MSTLRNKTGRSETGPALMAGLCAALLGASCATGGGPPTEAASAIRSARRMLDGNQWTTENLNIASEGSYCFGDTDSNCRQYGRLYAWDAALRACQSLGSGWRLPTDSEWMMLAKRHGGLFGDPSDGKTSLLTGGDSGFNALRGGNRSATGEYQRLEAHGFYWTASQTGASYAWFYNFGRASLLPNRHEDGDKQMAVSVRCIRA